MNSYQLNTMMCIASLERGGAENNFVALANSLQGGDVHTSIVSFQSIDHTHDLIPSIKVFQLEEKLEKKHRFKIIRNLQKIFLLRSIFKYYRPINVISFGTETNVVAIFAALGIIRNVIVSERCDPTFYPEKFCWRILRNLSYALGVKVVTQTKTAEKYFRFVATNKKFTIHNTVLPTITTANKITTVFPYVLAVGRLVEQKNFSLLIDAFKIFQTKFKSWNLIILGEGPLRLSLERQIEALNLNDNVQLLGKKKNIGDYYKQASIFVLSSKYEGFPNALLEAMSFSLPVISTNCLSGPAELIDDKINGLLIDNFDAQTLASSMAFLASSKQTRMKIGKAGKLSLRKFEKNKITAQWLSLLKN